jgi:mercuric ion transport protein
MKTQIVLGVFTALGASLCCITPVLAMVAGTGSIAANFSWIEPFRPYLISSTFLILGFAWFQNFTAKNEDECGCEKKQSFFQSRKFLGIITVLSLLLISFPSYSKWFFQTNWSLATTQDQDKKKKVTLSVDGMTCASCEHHIESEVIKLSGVSSVKASYVGKSATVEYDPAKVDEEKIIAAINKTGYTTSKNVSLLQDKSKPDCCIKGSCTLETCSSMPKVSVPNERSKNLQVLAGIEQLKEAFNQQPGKVKFVTILSSTCGWCLQGAQAVQETVLKYKAQKDISVIVVWTNMLKSDDKENAFKAASMFGDPSIVQYFDAENKFGDLVARRLTPQGQKAWDIYMFFDKDDKWTDTFPRPFEYAHQLSASLHPWADDTKYFCGNDLTKRLNDISSSL